MYSIYNFKYGQDLNTEAVKPFKQYLWKEYGMKPDFKFNKKLQRLYITCYGYSIEEKAKNKKMLLITRDNFLKNYFDLVK